MLCLHSTNPLLNLSNIIQSASLVSRIAAFFAKQAGIAVGGAIVLVLVIGGVAYYYSVEKKEKVIEARAIPKQEKEHLVIRVNDDGSTLDETVIENNMDILGDISEIQSLLKDMEEKDNTLQTLQTLIATKDEIKQEERLVIEEAKRLRDKNKEIERLKQENMELRQELRSFKEEIKKEIEEQNRVIKEIQQDIRNIINDYRIIKEQVVELIARDATRETQMQQQSQQIKELLDNNRKKEQENRELKESLKKRDEQIDKLLEERSNRSSKSSSSKRYHKSNSSQKFNILSHESNPTNPNELKESQSVGDMSLSLNSLESSTRSQERFIIIEENRTNLTETIKTEWTESSPHKIVEDNKIANKKKMSN